MPLPEDYLRYPMRRYGMDHELYEWSMLTARKPIVWPNKAPLAVWVNVCLQFYPLDQRDEPFKVPGGMTMPYPDLRHYTLRDYGNRVGIFRVFDALDQAGLKATFAVNGRLAERCPGLLQTVVDRGDEIIAHGWQMDTLHHEGQDSETEAALISKTLECLRGRSGQAVTGWLSPARCESSRTPELLSQNGIDYVCDWVNDDMPYDFRGLTNRLTAIPLSNELEDYFILQNNGHSEDSWVEQINDALEFLHQEGQQQGGRLLALNIHPWLMGQPHRISRLESVFNTIGARDGVWNASASDIVQHWRAQQDA